MLIIVGSTLSGVGFSASGHGVEVPVVLPAAKGVEAPVPPAGEIKCASGLVFNFFPLSWMSFANCT